MRADSSSDGAIAMSRYLVLCVVSAVLGGVVAVGVREWWREPAAVAQEAPPPRVRVAPPATGPLPPPAMPPAAPSGLPKAAAPATIPVDEGLTAEERTNIFVYEKVNRGVVNINTKSVRTENLFFEVPAEGAGSGSVIDRAGHVLTNYHVVEDAQEIKVTLSDGQTLEATVVGADPSNDIAVLKISAAADALHPIELGESAKLKVGQRIYAVGNPFGLERTMTTGIISSLNRSLGARNGRTMKSIIQLDAALNRGNSGGPLLDSRGRLIGMNTAIASQTGANTGVGFAIPVDTIRRVVPQLLRDGKVIRPDIGITRVFKTDNGLGIATLMPGGPAEHAGLKGFRITKQQSRRGPFVYEETKVDRTAADEITAIDGEKVSGVDDLLSMIERKRPGDEVMVTIRRGGKSQQVRVRLGAGE